MMQGSLCYHVEFRLKSGDSATCLQFLDQIPDLQLSREQQIEICGFLDRVALAIWSAKNFLLRDLHLDEYTTKITYQISDEGGIVSYDEPEIDFVFTLNGWPIICYVDLYLRSQAS